MRCAACGTENAHGAKFCVECGAPLARSCPSCASPVAAGAKFCGECGAALTSRHPQEAPPATPMPPPQAERRLVTVLFADLVGFTTVAEGRDAEETRELLSRYFDVARTVIGRYGGTVEKFIGDAVMAVWGAPVATEDDAERAVRAALELVAAIPTLGDEHGAPELCARAGVLTGEAAVTIGVEGEGMVAGDLVNTASRVQAVADPGSVLVGESTRRATDATIVYDAFGAFELKGKQGLTELWRALRIVSGVRGTLKSEGLEAPFVGRDRELRLVKDLFHACADDGKAHLVSVTGIAGIGKSRLMWEFYKYFDGITQGVFWHRGRCLSYGEGVTYWALADMVRMRCRIGEEEDPVTAQQKLRATLEEFVLDTDERSFVEPRLAQLLGLGELDGADRHDLFSAWRLFFERLSDDDPVVLAFEDMQWADAALLDFVEYLLEWSRSHPIYVLTLARPDLIERRPTWGAGHRNFTNIYLEPLGTQSMLELLNGLVPGLPDALCSRILERAEGVPLYAVETVRMLLDRGLLARDGAVYRVTGDVETLEVPETLHALVAARLDGLLPDERRILQDGAVLGKTFTRDGVAALCGLDSGTLQPLLGELVRKEVLSLEADPRSPEHGQYGFLQDIVRHVAYETLSRRERHIRHLAAAEYLSASGAEDEVAEVIAAHLVEAYRSSPDDADTIAVQGRARDALHRAAERASSLGAGAEAQRYFSQAAELTDDPLERARTIERAGRHAWIAGRVDDARALLDDAHGAYETLHEARAAARVSALIGELDFREGHTATAVARLRRAVETLGEGEPDADVAVVVSELGRFLMLSGESGEAYPFVEQALALAEALDLPAVLVDALNTKAMHLPRRNRPIEGRLVLEGALRIALDRGLTVPAIRTCNNLAVALDAADDVRGATAAIHNGIELARRAGNRSWLASLLTALVQAYVTSGRWDDALDVVAETAEMDPDPWARGTLAYAAIVYAERGDLDLARETFDRFATPDVDDPQAVAERRTVDSRLLRLEGRSGEALAQALAVVEMREVLGVNSGYVKEGLDEALAAASASSDLATTEQLLTLIDTWMPGQRTPLVRAHRHRYGARLAAVSRDGDPGVGFAAAVELYDGAGVPFARATTQFEHATWLVEQGCTTDAEPLLAAARETFAALAAPPWLERVDAVARERHPVA